MQACYVKIIWLALTTIPREIVQNTFFLPFLLFIYLFIFILKGITKITFHEMHECYTMQILKNKKTKLQKENGHTEYWDEAQGPWKPKMTRGTGSHQLLDEISQTYFYQEVWWRC